MFPKNICESIQSPLITPARKKGSTAFRVKRKKITRHFFEYENSLINVSFVHRPRGSEDARTQSYSSRTQELISESQRFYLFGILI